MAFDSLSQRQPHAASVLGAALRGGRLHHAYLLLGDPREGLALARAVARALICPERREADGCRACAACRKFEGGNHPDVLQLAPNERQSILLDPVRELIARLSLRAAEAATKVVIVERADLMNVQAQNAFLKTLEEPPGATCFLLTAARLRAVLPTVRSRCLMLRLAPPNREQACERLVQAGIEAPLARALAPLVGDNEERALELVQAGADEVHASLTALLGRQADRAQVLEAAAELATDKDRAELALAMLEVYVRDALARKYGAHGELLYDGDAALKDVGLGDLAARLVEARQLSAVNVNRTMLLESVLAPLSACTRAGDG